MQIKHDPLTGKFTNASAAAATTEVPAAAVPGVYGCGIAFPEFVVDPEGNKEYAIGWYKFMKFVSRVSPKWIED